MWCVLYAKKPKLVPHVPIGQSYVDFPVWRDERYRADQPGRGIRSVLNVPCTCDGLLDFGRAVLERFFSRKERVRLFRSWAGGASMWIKVMSRLLLGGLVVDICVRVC